MRWLLTILFGLFVIWTGIFRCIQAGAFKPNAFWFCTAMGLMAIAAGFMHRINWRIAGTTLAVLSGATVLAFYAYCFVVQPEKDATVRVGMVIVASLAQLVFALLPQDRNHPS